MNSHRGSAARLPPVDMKRNMEWFKCRTDDLSHFQCNGAFAAAKQYHKAPAAIAGEVASALEGSPLFQGQSPQAWIFKFNAEG